MTSVPLSVVPLSAALLGTMLLTRRRNSASPIATVPEILAAALAAEDRALTEEPNRANGRRGQVSGFNERSPAPKLVEVEAPAQAGRGTFAADVAITRAHRQRRAGLEETMLALYHGNLSLFRAEETARGLWGDDANGALISASAEEVTARIEGWLKRPLTRRYDFVYLDTLALRQRLKDGARETSLHYAVGIDGDGAREVLGVGAGAAGEAAWRGFLRDLRRRGLKEVRLFIGGMDEELTQAVAAEFPAVRLQVCIAQLEREVLARAPGAGLHAATQACAALHPEPENGVSGEKIRQMLERFNRNDLAEASALLVRMLPFAFSYRPFPRSQWAQLSSTDAIRRAVKPFRERLRHIGPIDEPRALVLLAAAHLRHVSRTLWGRRRFLRARPAAGKAKD